MSWTLRADGIHDPVYSADPLIGRVERYDPASKEVVESVTYLIFRTGRAAMDGRYVSPRSGQSLRDAVLEAAAPHCCRVEFV